MSELDDIQTTWRTNVDAIVGRLESQVSLLSTENAALEEALRTAVHVIPTEEYAGVPAGVELEPIYGPQTLTTPGQSFYRKRFLGQIWMKAPGISFEECEMIGPPDGTPIVSQALINAIDEKAKGWYAKRCTIKPQVPHWLLDCVHSWHGTMEDCIIEGGTDIFSQIPYRAGDLVYNEVFGSILKNPTFWTGAKGVVHPSDTKTHNDLLALLGGTGGYFHHNRMDAYFAPVGGTQDYPDTRANACVQYNNGKGPVLGVRVENNWMSGGQYAVNLGAIPAGQKVGTIAGNIITPTQRLKGRGIYSPTATLVDVRGNSWSSNGSLVEVSKS